MNFIDSLLSFLALSFSPVSRITHCRFFQNIAGFLASGIDIKSVLLNIASALLFLLPFVVYFASEYAQEGVLAVVISFAIAFLAPPWGWKRPHPYSDNPKNVPYPSKAN